MATPGVCFLSARLLFWRNDFAKQLWECLWSGIHAVRPGARLGDIGAAIQTVAESRGYSVVRDFASRIGA